VCDCLKDLKVGLVTLHGHPAVEYGPDDIEFTEGVDTFYSLTEDPPEDVLGIIRYRYHPVSSSLPVRKFKSWKYSFIKPSFCPICGASKLKDGK
jgi:hypothetical protein